MVTVSKIAVWEVEGEIFRDVKGASSRARRAIIQELIDEEMPSEDEMANFIATHWDRIEQQLDRAMAST